MKKGYIEFVLESIYHCFVVDASKKVLFPAISTVEGLKGWWTDFVMGIYKKGGDIFLGFNNENDIGIRVIEIRKNEYVKWICQKGPKDWLGTEMAFALSAYSRNSTLVKFNHTGWSEKNDFFGECNFHWAHFMRSLKQYCEKGQGTPFRYKSE